MLLPALRTSPQLNPTAQRILNLLNTCISPKQLLQIQAQILLLNLHPNTHITSTFITTCKSIGLLHSALLLFSQLPNPHVFICNSLMRAFSHNSSSPHTSFLIYTHMHKASISPNNYYTFPLVLKSLSDLRLLPKGQTIHTHVIKTGHSHDIYIQNSLLDLYSSCMDMNTCEQLFDEMPMRDVVSWTTLITGYRKIGRLDEALIAFERMQFSGISPNPVTMVNVLAACASYGALEMGVWIHDHIRKSGWELDVILGTSLIDMYAKCGRIDVGMNVFLSMVEKNVYTWNSLIRGLALAKSGEEALRWFFRMEHEGIKPDAITLIGVLCACSHSGLVEMGQWIFNSVINKKYRFLPGIKHYGCMVDLLGRAGLLEEALQCIEKMPFEPNIVIWGSLLGSCRVHGDLELSEFAAKRLVELEPENGTYYVLLSNIYAEMGRWRDVEEVRRLMRERGLKKDVGWSLAESDMVEDCVG